MKTATFRKAIFMALLAHFTVLHCQGGSVFSVTPNPAVVGCPDSFTYNIAATDYQWNFGNDATPSTIGGAGYQTAATIFGHPGPHRVIVSALTGGGWITDSITITVNPNPINITLSANVDTVCYGLPITYTVAPSGYLLYQFYVNGQIVQSSTGRVFVASGLNAGDSVSAYAFDGVCFSSNAVHHPVIKPIPSPPTLTSSDANDTICGGDTIIFTAQPAGAGIYNFYNGGTMVQSTGLNTWSTAQLGQGNSVHVLLSQNGCTSNWSNIIITYLKPTPLVITNSNLPICDGQPATIIAVPSGLYFEFILNGQTLQSGVINSYVADTLHAGDLLTVQGTLNGCTSIPDTVVIYNNPLPPVLTVSGNVLSTTPADGFGWYFNSVSISGAGSQTYTATQSGTYVVEVFNQYGCGAKSAPVTVQVSDVQETGRDAVLKIIQTDNTGFTWQVSDALIGKTLEMFDITGQRIFSTLLRRQSGGFYYHALTPGLYIFQVEDYQYKVVLH